MSNLKIRKYIKDNIEIILIGNVHIMKEKKWEEIKNIFNNVDVVLCEGLLSNIENLYKPIKDVYKTKKYHNSKNKYGYSSVLCLIYYIIAEITNCKTQNYFYNSVDKKYVFCDKVENDLNLSKIDNIEKQVEKILNKYNIKDKKTLNEFIKKIKTKKFIIFPIKIFLNILLNIFSNDIFINVFKPSNYNEIICKRNKSVIDGINYFSNNKKIGILYGKGHFKDLNKRIKEIGFK